MSLNFNAVIFVDKTSKDYLEARWPSSEKRVYIIRDLADFVTSSWSWEKEALLHAQDGKSNYIDLYKIWNEKVFFMRSAIEKNVYNTEKFVWVDIGCFRVSSKMYLFSDFPLATNIDENRVSVLEIIPVIKKDVNFEVINVSLSEKLNHINWLEIGGFIGGTMFAGSIRPLLEFANIHFLLIKEAKKNNVLICSDDQHLMSFAVRRHPDLFKVYPPIHPWTGDGCYFYNPWYTFHILWSGCAEEIIRRKTELFALQCASPT
jgi:hypothetical protein